MKHLPSFLALFCFCLPFALSAQSAAVGEWKTSFPDDKGNMIPVHLSIKADNTYAVDFGADGTVDIKGKYMDVEGHLTIQDTEGSDCAGEGVYQLEVTAGGMKMTRISDECEGRGGPDGVMAFERA